MTHSTHFIYGYMTSDINYGKEPLRYRETKPGYSFRSASSVLLYASSHRQDSTYHGLCYTKIYSSKLDYGCIVYGSARKSYLQMLDPIHNQGLRLCLGEFRTSPVESFTLMHTNIVWVLDVQSYLCSISIPKSLHILHITWCLTINI